jgi:hypothetical protein
MKVQPQIIDAAAKKIAAELLDSDNTEAGSIFAETLTAMLAEPVGGILRSVEQTRDALDEAMQIAASVSNGTAPDELPKPAGMPMSGCQRDLQKNRNRKARYAFTTRQRHTNSSRAAKIGKRIRSGVVGVSKPLRESPPSLDGAEH